MNKKARHLGKRKTDSLARKRSRKLHTLEYENSYFKKKLLFISMKIQLITISSAIPYILGMNSISSSLKKKKSQQREREREKEEERVRTGGKRRRKRRRNKRKRRKKRKKLRERY